MSAEAPARRRAGKRTLLQRLRRGIRRLLRQEILVLGDSHATVFDHPSLVTRFPRYFFKVAFVSAATASGLENPNSKTQAYPLFRRSLEKSRARKVIVLLGEVDTGFVIWYRAEKYHSSVAEMRDKAVQVYFNFLREIARDREVICVSAPLPTIRDGTNWGEVANARREVTATQRERTELTVAFNQAVQELCTRESIRYVSLDAVSRGEDGLVKADLLNADPSNHHYDADHYAALIGEGFDSILRPNS